MGNNSLCFLLSVLVSISLPVANGCTIEGINSWLVPETQTILDTFKGNIWDRSTSDIEAINSITHREGLFGGPYVTISFTESRLIISTNEAFRNYEEVETSQTMGFTINFRCTGGTARPFVFTVSITDTNNNNPIFRPSNNYTFTIAPPLPPGFLITNCANDIIVRDIDLTTERIDFEVSDSTLFQINYDDSSTVAKEFKAALSTKTFIRTITEPIILTVTATDVDRTGDPRRSATASVTIIANTEFELPEEPIFSQPFYLASYTTEHEIILQDSVYLRQGYDEHVIFSFEGQHSEYFDLVIRGNGITFNMKSPLPVDLYREGQIFLVVKAERQYTSGATATIVVQLPEAISLEFEKAVYEGIVVDNELKLEDIKLKQGYQNTTIRVQIISDYSTYFTSSIEENTITLAMDPLSTTILEQNTFINLQVIATTGLNSTGTTIITLEIIYDDVTTPVFERNIYIGNYERETGLKLEPIVLIQGYDSTVNVMLEGEYYSLFELKQDGAKISLDMTSVPPELLEERNILVSVRAIKPRTVGAHAVIQVIFPTARELNFEKQIYKGNIEANIIALETIVLNVGYASDVIFNLTGDHANHFTVNSTNNEILLVVNGQLPEHVLENNFIVLILSAFGANTVTTSTTILLEIVKQEIITPVFSQYIYRGTFWNDTSINFDTISLIQGYDETVTFALNGDHAKYFSINTDEGRVIISLNTSIPEELIFNEKVLVFNVKAEKPRTVGANAAISLTFPQELTEPTILKFSQNTYTGLLKNGILSTQEIILESGFTSEIKFSFRGEFMENFALTNINNMVTIKLSDFVSLEDLENNSFIILEIEAIRNRTVPVTSTLIIDIFNTEAILPVFEEAYYRGTYSKESGLEFKEIIKLRLGFDDTVKFELGGEYAQWFSIVQDDNSVSLRSNETNSIPDEVFIAKDHLLFSIVARKLNTIGGQSAIFINLLKEVEKTVILQFEYNNYVGHINNGSLQLNEIRMLDVDISSVQMNLTGEYASYFSISNSTSYVIINLLETPILEKNLIILNLEASKISAISGHTTVVLEIIREATQITLPVFEEPYYNGKYSKQGLEFSHIIRLVQGFDDTVYFDLESDDSRWFSLYEKERNSLTILVKDENGLSSINDRSHLIFIVVANKTGSKAGRTAVIISLIESATDSYVSFDKILYNGNITSGVLFHESIRVSGFTRSEIDIVGEYATLFRSSAANCDVTVQVVASATVPENLVYIPLILQADNASAVLLIDIITGEPDLPSVTFSSPSYFLWADINQTGVVGRVNATVDSGEAVVYSLIIEDNYLQERVSVNADGEIEISTTLNAGAYNFKVKATAVTSVVSATVPVLLRVDTLPECSTENGLSPLIILERVEEKPHLNLVVLNHTEHRGCRYIMNNVWPKDQSWLYVDNEGLHARAIDREHNSIAFMILSQIQVELILNCDNDAISPIMTRSLTTEVQSELDSYNYGSNKWILADTITYNAWRSVVNLIVEDINDNSPIFAGKANEPIYVGYPIQELENTILPRALIQLKATDADIGENAAIIYWSRNENLAIAPTTGFVHVRNNVQLENDSRFTVYATDQNGRGLNGSLDFVVKLLDRNQISVITVQNAFLDDEDSILDNLSKSVGYEIKVLRTVVITQNNEETRRKREISSTFKASLQLFVYGMFERQPVDVTTLTSDLNQVTSVNNIRAKSLSDHLEGIEVCSAAEEDNALLAATIALAVLLFIVLIAIAIWFILKWKRKPNYENFSDANSLASGNETQVEPKAEVVLKPRLDIGELKKSERRLQEMLDAPVPDITVQPPNNEVDQGNGESLITLEPEEIIVDIAPIVEPPIIIQTIDKLKDNKDESGDDEFGETKVAPRKSVVTFNENVEKIIHLEDGIDDSPDPIEEIFRF